MDERERLNGDPAPSTPREAVEERSKHTSPRPGEAASGTAPGDRPDGNPAVTPDVEAELIESTDPGTEADLEAESEGGSVQETITGAIVSGLSAVADRISRAVSPPGLANLYELHPEARQGSPRELGLRFVPVEEIKGTAVAGAAQRGEDFLPLRPFRGDNWHGRWQRIRDANRRLRPLPPVDLVKWDGEYWVVDGHNRVGAALADHAAGLDAMVTELVPLDGQQSERPTSLLPLIGELAELRAAVAGHAPAMGVRFNDPSNWTDQEPADEYGSTRESHRSEGEVA